MSDVNVVNRNDSAHTTKQINAELTGFGGVFVNLYLWDSKNVDVEGVAIILHLVHRNLQLSDAFLDVIESFPNTMQLTLET